MVDCSAPKLAPMGTMLPCHCFPDAPQAFQKVGVAIVIGCSHTDEGVFHSCHSSHIRFGFASCGIYFSQYPKVPCRQLSRQPPQGPDSNWDHVWAAQKVRGLREGGAPSSVAQSQLELGPHGAAGILLLSHVFPCGSALSLD